MQAGSLPERARFQLLCLTVAFPTVLLTVGVVGWLVGLPIEPLWLPLAFAACVLGMLAASPSAVAAIALACGIASGLTVLAVVASVGTIDVFYDSRVYHQPALIALSGGWNPIAEPNVCAWSREFCLPTQGKIDHYPKGAWVVSAAFAAFVGQIEAGRAGQGVTLLAAVLATYRLLRGFAFVPAAGALVASVLLGLDPVAIEQLQSAYVDGWLASALLLFGVLGLDFVFHGRRASLVLSALALPFALGIKFTAVPFAGVLALTLVALAWMRRPQAIRPLVTWLVPAGLLGVAVLGFHPYVTNTLATGNPFHPAFRPSGPGILARMASPEFIARDRFSRFVIAQGSRPSPGDWREPAWVVPLAGWRVTPEVDDRFSGFGEPFAPALLLALAALCLARSRVAWLLFGGVTVTLFVSEAGWWARLAPQAWWLPGLAAVAACWLPGRPAAARLLGGAILALLSYVVATTLLVTALQAWTGRLQLAALLGRLAEEPAVIVPDADTHLGRRAFALSLRRRLQDAGTDLPVVRSPPRPCTFEYHLTGASVCFQPVRGG